MPEKIFEYISKLSLENVCKSFEKLFALGVEVSDTEGNIIYSSGHNTDVDFCNLVGSCAEGRGRCRQQRIRSINMAMDIGQPYITICHAGILLGCVPIMDGDIPLGGLFFGKCLCENIGESLLKDISDRLYGIMDNSDVILRSLIKLNNIPTRKIQAASEQLFILLYRDSPLDPDVMHWRREKSRQQAEIGEYIAEQKRFSPVQNSPYEYERQLMSKVRIGDKTQTREILNTMLASIMLKSPGQMNVLKARLMELLTVLSRAAVEGGVDVDLLLEKNLQNIIQLIEVNNQQDLCAWVGRAIDDFVELVHDNQNSRRVSQIQPATDFIEKNFSSQISLSDVAKASHLSPSRLAHIFKDQTGMTIVDYITQVRIEQAKNLLISTDQSCTEICFGVGYNNQSYFTRTFKELVGVTPRQFRSMNRSGK